MIRRSDGNQTRRKLLEAAGAVFAARGYRAATTAEICRRAHANIAAVNYHFRSKEQLYVEAWRHAFERGIRAYPPDGGLSAGAPAGERLRGQIDALVRRILDPASIDLDIAHHEMAEPTGLLAEVMRRSFEPLHRRFMAIVRELLGRGVTEQEVRLCTMSIDAQCFMPLVHERRRRAAHARGRAAAPLLPAADAAMLADHICAFSLAGLRGRRRLAHRGVRPGGAA